MEVVEDGPRVVASIEVGPAECERWVLHVRHRHGERLYSLDGKIIDFKNCPKNDPKMSPKGVLKRTHARNT